MFLIGFWESVCKQDYGPRSLQATNGKTVICVNLGRDGLLVMPLSDVLGFDCLGFEVRTSAQEWYRSLCSAFLLFVTVEHSQLERPAFLLLVTVEHSQLEGAGCPSVPSWKSKVHQTSESHVKTSLQSNLFEIGDKNFHSQVALQ